ncbi:FCD domain-containing protein [Gemmobacter denitrificans]|uniref:FCD domain-containing protein n=1 Tax=Gemmobacter denitrificans TaxID=3123040 RepID=A0ABU8BZE7_9RHOB
MTLAEKAYAALRHDIIRGELPPGKPLRMADLSTRYDMGFSPLREALNRLQAERLVEAVALRGFTVAPLSLAEMEDALRLRILIESEALRSAILLGGDDWASGIVAALYALKLQVDRRSEGGDVWELETRHHAFHRALLVACGSVWMLEFFERLYTATERYRIPILLDQGAESGRDIHAEHAAIAEAVLARRADDAVALLAAHYTQTAQAIAAKMAVTG